MSKVKGRIKKRSEESQAFANAYKNARIQSDYADLLFQLKEESGLSSTEFSEKAKKSRATIRRIEKRDMEPSLSTFNELAAPFGKEVKLVLVDKND